MKDFILFYENLSNNNGTIKILIKLKVVEDGKIISMLPSSWQKVLKRSCSDCLRIRVTFLFELDICEHHVIALQSYTVIC